MKKIVLWIMVAVCVMIGVEPVFALYKLDDYDAESPSAKVKVYNKKMEALLRDTKTFADKIAAFNKPAFEAKLTKKEREYYEMGEDSPYTSPIMWERVYVKDKTLVYAKATKNKKFTASNFITTDPAFTFIGGIKVGASIKVLENYFGDTVNNMGVAEGKKIILYGPVRGIFVDMEGGEVPTIGIVCENGVITQIKANFLEVIADGNVGSRKTWNFAENKLKQMGFKGLQDIVPFMDWNGYLEKRILNN